MSPAYQAVQIAHAVADFTFQFPKQARVWHDTSNSIIALSVRTERDLYALTKTLSGLNLNYTTFREPDIGHAITALALCPGKEARKFCRDMDMALRPAYRYRGGLDGLKIERFDRQDKRIKQVVRDMANCNYSEGQTVLDHGLEIAKNLYGILDSQEGILSSRGLRISGSISNSEEILVQKNARYVMEKAAIFSGCGCVGKLTSYQTWMKKCGGDEEVGDLIKALEESGAQAAEEKGEFIMGWQTI